MNAEVSAAAVVRCCVCDSPKWKALVQWETIDVHERCSRDQCASKYFNYFDARSQKQVFCLDTCKVLALPEEGAASKVEMYCYDCSMAGCSLSGPSAWELALKEAGIACPKKNGGPAPAAYNIPLRKKVWPCVEAGQSLSMSLRSGPRRPVKLQYLSGIGLRHLFSKMSW